MAAPAELTPLPREGGLEARPPAMRVTSGELVFGDWHNALAGAGRAPGSVPPPEEQACREREAGGTVSFVGSPFRIAAENGLWYAHELRHGEPGPPRREELAAALGEARRALDEAGGDEAAARQAVEERERALAEHDEQRDRGVRGFVVVHESLRSPEAVAAVVERLQEAIPRPCGTNGPDEATRAAGIAMLTRYAWGYYAREGQDALDAEGGSKRTRDRLFDYFMTPACLLADPDPARFDASVRPFLARVARDELGGTQSPPGVAAFPGGAGCALRVPAGEYMWGRWLLNDARTAAHAFVMHDHYVPECLLELSVAGLGPLHDPEAAAALDLARLPRPMRRAMLKEHALGGAGDGNAGMVRRAAEAGVDLVGALGGPRELLEALAELASRDRLEVARAFAGAPGVAEAARAELAAAYARDAAAPVHLRRLRNPMRQARSAEMVRLMAGPLGLDASARGPARVPVDNYSWMGGAAKGAEALPEEQDRDGGDALFEWFVEAMSGTWREADPAVALALVEAGADPARWFYAYGSTGPGQQGARVRALDALLFGMRKPLPAPAGFGGFGLGLGPGSAAQPPPPQAVVEAEPFGAPLIAALLAAGAEPGLIRREGDDESAARFVQSRDDAVANQAAGEHLAFVRGLLPRER